VCSPKKVLIEKEYTLESYPPPTYTDGKVRGQAS